MQNTKSSNTTPQSFDDGLGDLDPQDFACVVLPDLDYDSQLIAIRQLLRVHENIDSETIKEIKDIEKFAKNTTGLRNQHAVDEWVDRLQSSVYQSAAHSMSAVGMLSPLFESVFYQSFKGIEKEIFSGKQTSRTHSRWKLAYENQWDCHFAWDKREKCTKKDVIRGIMQLSKATGLEDFLPHDIGLVLKVLFSYRNKMFHCGFEWPVEERKSYWSYIQSENWPSRWLKSSTSGGEPWIIYLSSEFIWHCITRIEETIGAIGQYVYETAVTDKSTNRI